MVAIEIKHLKDAERILRIAMILILATAGISKLMSHGGFYSYYVSQFGNQELRINLPLTLVNLHLLITRYLELTLACALLFTPIRRHAIVACCIWFMIIQFGHYVLQEWSSVNEITIYYLLNVCCYVLPSHNNWIRRG